GQRGGKEPPKPVVGGPPGGDQNPGEGVEKVALYQRGWDSAQGLGAPGPGGLGGFEDIPVKQLSAGQQRRVALARLWLTRATLWILDEPFTAIDVNGVDRLTQRMAQHTEQGGIVILTTHQPLNVAESKIRRISLTQTGDA
ncbi:ATP-binding cassette domain-containing protein, partial [Escherichia coli]|nr:ATP-binding cassette domain-containing protein [Escherichia coli]